MTEAAPDRLATFLNLWVKTLEQVLQQVSGATISCAIVTAPSVAASSSEKEKEDLWLLTSLSGGLRGELSIHIPAFATTILGRLFLGESGDDSVESATSEHAEAVLELLRQIGGLVATGASSSWGEVHIHMERGGAPSWPASSTVWLRAGEEGPAAATFEIQISAALAAALRSEGKQESTAPVPSTSTENHSPEPEVNLGVLMDVELAITLRFGGRRMLLREILDLNSGSVVELDRQVNDPVDLLLDGQVVARGEVVVVDGNYGLRITQIGAGA